MSLLADAIQPACVAKVYSVLGRPRQLRLADAIGGEAGAFDIDVNESMRSLALWFRDPDVLIGVLAADINRFSTAAFQSISAVPNDGIPKDALPWVLIKLYYASFYAGHMIMCLLGEACSFIENTHTKNINERLAAIGNAPKFQIEAGLYHVSLDAAVVGLYCKKIGRASGGTHEAFWRIFRGRLDKIKDGILGGPLIAAESQMVFNQLNDLGRILCKNGPPTWLSATRNELQYRHPVKFWFPCEASAKERDAIRRAISRWREEPMEITMQRTGYGDIGDFVAACTFIVSFCRVLIERIAERAPRPNRSFPIYGPLRYLRD